MYPNGDVFVPKIDLLSKHPLGPHIRVWAKFKDGRKLLGLKFQIRLAIGKQTLESDDMKIRLHSPVAASPSELANLPEWVNGDANEWAMISTQNEISDWRTLAKAVEMYYFGKFEDRVLWLSTRLGKPGFFMASFLITLAVGNFLIAQQAMCDLKRFFSHCY